MKKVTLYALSILSLAMLAACQPAQEETHQRKPLGAVLKKLLKALRVLEVHILKSQPSKRIFHQVSIRMILIALQILTRARILTIQ